MQRRKFLATDWRGGCLAHRGASAASAGAFPGLAQPRAIPEIIVTWVAFLKRMAELGYRDGQDFILDFVETPKRQCLRSRFPRADGAQA